VLQILLASEFLSLRTCIVTMRGSMVTKIVLDFKLLMPTISMTRKTVRQSFGAKLYCFILDMESLSSISLDLHNQLPCLLSMGRPRVFGLSDVVY